MSLTLLACCNSSVAAFRSGEHGAADNVMSKLHEHSVLTFHKILTTRRVLEREKSDKSRQNRPDPPWV